MGTSNYAHDTSFLVWAFEYEPDEDWYREEFPDESDDSIRMMMAEDRDMEYRQVEEAVRPMLDRLNSDLLFHRLGIRSGYYDGIQVYVDEPSQDRWLVPELRDAWEQTYGEDSVPDDTRLLGVYADERTRIRKWLRDNLPRLGFHALRYTSPWTIERVENPSRRASGPKAKVPSKASRTRPKAVSKTSKPKAKNPAKRSRPKESSKTIKPKTKPKNQEKNSGTKSRKRFRHVQTRTWRCRKETW